MVQSPVREVTGENERIMYERIYQRFVHKKRRQRVNNKIKSEKNSSCHFFPNIFLKVRYLHVTGIVQCTTQRSFGGLPARSW